MTVKSYMKRKFPKIYGVYKKVFVRKKEVVSFSGWGMRTMSIPPWECSNYGMNKDFLEVNKMIREKVSSGKFLLSQFETIDNSVFRIDDLMWRHYVVYWSANLALNQTSSTRKVFVECGVCDGLTVFFAISSCEILSKEVECYLYDSWGAMRGQDLTGEEKKNEGKYGYLDLNNTIKNLSCTQGRLHFLKGFIPEVFEDEITPEVVSWVHIDLNASKPTKESMEFFYDKIEAGGVMLFDDYGSPGFKEIRKCVDEFLNEKKGSLLHLPTRQAVFVKYG